MSVALKAAELLELKGFKQGSYEGNSGCMCIFGALISVAVPNRADRSDPVLWDSWYLRQQELNKEHAYVVAAVRKAVEETGWQYWDEGERARLVETYTEDVVQSLEKDMQEDNQSYVVRWNDETGRTQEEVVAVLKRADEILEGK